MPSKKLRSVGIEPGDDGTIVASGTLVAHPKWRLEAEFTPRDGGYIVSRTLIEPVSGDPGESGITSVMLRSLPLAELRDSVHKTTLAATGEPFLAAAFGRPAAKEFRRRPRPGRAGRDDRHYAVLAAKYVTLSRTSRRPVVELASWLNVATTTARDALVEARRRGLLTRRPKGQAGGQLTDRARTLVEDGVGQ